MNKQASLLCGDGLPGEVTLDGIRRLRAKPDKKFVDGQDAIPSS